MLDVHQVNHTTNDLAIGHILKIDGLASLVTAEPDLLEVVIQLLDDIVLASSSVPGRASPWAG